MGYFWHGNVADVHRTLFPRLMLLRPHTVLLEVAKLHTPRVHGVGGPAQGHHPPPHQPPAPVAVHHHPQLEHQVQDQQGEDEAEDALSSLLQHADSIETTEKLQESENSKS